MLRLNSRCAYARAYVHADTSVRTRDTRKDHDSDSLFKTAIAIASWLDWLTLKEIGESRYLISEEEQRDVVICEEANTSSRILCHLLGKVPHARACTHSTCR